MAIIKGDKIIIPKKYVSWPERKWYHKLLGLRRRKDLKYIITDFGENDVIIATTFKNTH